MRVRKPVSSPSPDSWWSRMNCGGQTDHKKLICLTTKKLPIPAITYFIINYWSSAPARWQQRAVSLIPVGTSLLTPSTLFTMFIHYSLCFGIVHTSQIRQRWFSKVLQARLLAAFSCKTVISEKQFVLSFSAVPQRPACWLFIGLSLPWPFWQNSQCSLGEN